MTKFVVFKDGKFVLEKHTRQFDDEFKQLKSDNNNGGGFDIEDRTFYRPPPRREYFFEEEQDDMFQKSFGSPVLPSAPPTTPPNTLAANTSSVANPNAPYETMEQHKYARLSRAAYTPDRSAYLFGNMDELKGFELDGELSTKKHSVFHNNTTGETVIAYKGTDPKNFDDLKTDMVVASVFNENNTKRFKKSEQVYLEAVEKYGKVDATTGHSLGGDIALFIGRKHDIQSYTFNPAVSFQKAFQTNPNNTSKQYIFRTKNDAVSVGANLIQDKHTEIITVKQKSVVDNHGLDNFYNIKAVRNPDGTFQVDESKQTLEDPSNAFFNILGEGVKDVVAVVKEEINDTNPLENGLKEFRGFNESEAHTFGLDKVADALKSNARKNTDKLMDLAASQTKSTNMRTNLQGDIISKGGVKYIQVEGGN